MIFPSNAENHENMIFTLGIFMKMLFFMQCSTFQNDKMQHSYFNLFQVLKLHFHFFFVWLMWNRLVRSARIAQHKDVNSNRLNEHSYLLMMKQRMVPCSYGSNHSVHVKFRRQFWAYVFPNNSYCSNPTSSYN